MKKVLKRLACLLAALLFFSGACAQDLSAGTDCGDEACPIPTVDEAGEPVYAIVSPVGYHAVDMNEQAPQTDTPDWLKGVVRQQQIWTIATMNPGETAFLIAGDSARNKFMVLPGGGYVTIEIRLPEDWDTLIAPMGYEPLSQFILQEAE